MRRIFAVAAAMMMVPVLMLSDARAVPTFGAPVTVPNADVTEPGIDVGVALGTAPGGTIFVNGPRGLGFRSSLWRSTDGGASYNRVPFPTPYGQLPGGGDSDVALTETGRVYFLDLSGVSNSLARSDNNGATWAWGTPFTTLPLSDRQWMAVGGPGDTPGSDTVYIVYALIQSPQQVMVARSRDSGMTWTTQQIAPSIGGATGFTGQLVADSSDYVGFIYHQNGRMNYAWSTNAGGAWAFRAVSTSSAVNTMPSVALVGSTLHATWIRAGDFAVMESRSTDKGATWSAERVVSAGGTNMFSWIDARGSKVGIAWYGSDSSQAPDFNPGPWFVRYSESTDAGVTYTAAVNAVAAPAKQGPICTAGLACGGDRELGDFLQVAIDRQGKSLIAYDEVFGAGNMAVKVVKQLS